MKKMGLGDYLYRILIVILAGVPLLYQNCQHPYDLKPTDPTQYDSMGRKLYKSQITVGASKENPPLNLVFIVDNSASMYGHQIDLGTAFSTMFNTNAASLANFDSRLFVYSTASTTNGNTIRLVPTRSPDSITTVPSSTNTTLLATTPGAIYGIWNKAQGTYGTVPFSAQINPAPVLDMESNSVTAFINNSKKGGKTDSEYEAQINGLTSKFQRRLAYLDPRNQLSYGQTTDISSGLCTLSRLLNHSDTFVRPGDSAAFIIISDDNDRLNVANANNNQCIENVTGSNNLIDGYCGHYETDFSYIASSSLTYKYDTTFNYESGTTIAYKYPSSEDCAYSYNNGYNYTSTYTAIKTKVTYDKCTTIADRTCVASTKNAVQIIDGNYVGANGACTQNMTSLVSSPLAGTSFSCENANLTLQAGPTGVDSNSDGISCSPAVLNSLFATNRKDFTCTITSLSTANSTASKQTLNSCANYCANNTNIKGCNVTSTTVNKTSGTLSFNTNGVKCDSTCPDNTACGTGSINSYLSTTYGSSVTCSATANLSTITANTAVNLDGTAYDCNSSVNPLVLIKNSSGNQICASSNSISACITSLQKGTNSITPSCSVSANSTSTITAPAGITCSTNCSNSSGFCDPTKYSTVQDFVNKTYNGLCTSASNGGAQTLTLKFNNAVAPTASCSSKCSDTTTGACDANGFGASNNATVSDFLQSQKGAISCSPNTKQVKDSNKMSIDPSLSSSTCTQPTSPFFFPSGSIYAAAAAVTYVAGDSTHKAVDFRNHIVNKSNVIFGANNKPAVAVITQLQGDNLPGTDVGTEYINLAQAMGSNQVSSIKADYSVALSQISDFIVKSTLNSYVLPIDSSQVMVTISILRVGTTVTQVLDPAMWTWAGNTLSISPSANLQIGDQIIYQYRAP